MTATGIAAPIVRISLQTRPNRDILSAFHAFEKRVPAGGLLKDLKAAPGTSSIHCD